MQSYRSIWIGLLLLTVNPYVFADISTGDVRGSNVNGLKQAVAEFKLGEYASALELLSIVPPSPQRDYYSGLSELKVGNSKRAVEILRQVTVDQPSNAEAYYALAAANFRRLEEVNVFRKFSVFRKFRRNLETTLTLQPEHVNANVVYILFLLEAPRFLGETKHQVDTRISKFGELKPAHAEYLRGYRAQKRGNLKAAESHFKRAVDVGELPRATYALANLYLDTARYDQSIVYSQKLSESESRWDDPSKSDAFQVMARAQIRMGNVSKGLHHLQQALALCPDGKVCARLEAEIADLK